MIVQHQLAWTPPLATDALAANMATSAGASYAILGIHSADEVGLQFTWTGTSPVGTMSFAASNNFDPSTNAGSGATWTTVPSTVFSSTSAFNPAGSASDCIATLTVKDVVRAKWLKITYTPTSGTGTLKCYSHSKG
jgi:hypothetical protein